MTHADLINARLIDWSTDWGLKAL